MNSFQILAQLISSQIVNCLVLGLAIAALATAASALIARRNSGTRFAVWFAAMLAIASLFFVAKPLAHSAAAVHVGTPEISLPAQWALYIFLAWAFFAAVGLARVARGLWRVRSLKKSCVPLAGSLPNGMVNPATSRGIAICTSESLRVPAALGFFHPVIALPGWTLRELSSEELNAVVLHEAAHLERWDDWTNLAQKVIRALLFFHPAVWWIDSRLSIEREMSCDDVVLSRSQNARRYAACLVSLAEKTHAHRSLALVQAAIGHMKHTAQRISKILDGRQRKVAPVFKPALAAVMAFGAISMVAVQHAPELVSFRSTESPTASADRFDYVATVNPPAAKAVAASLHLSPAAPRTRTRTLAFRPKPAQSRVPHTVNRAPLPTEEARKPIEKRNPAIVNAAMTDATPSFVYLVTQSQQFDSFGNLTVTTSVWRIRVARPAPAQAQSGVVPHST
jgi:bla regulator protein blaR1